MTNESEDSTRQVLPCPACDRRHDDWDRVDAQTTPTKYGYGRAVELGCNRDRCDGTVVLEQ